MIHDTADPEVIVVEFDVAVENASGDPFRLPSIQVLRGRCGEIVSLRDYWNPQAFAALLTQT